MDCETTRRLRALNRDFYRVNADTFAATRGRPWPGWQRLFAAAPEGGQSILDLGCGNGRLADLLGDRGPHLYVGLDNSIGLLAHAARRLSTRDRSSGRAGYVAAWDIFGERLPRPPAGGYGLVALFGVVHHIPARRLLMRTVHNAFQQVATGGRMAISVWQFAGQERFRGRALPAATAGLPSGVLGDDDYLLPWQRQAGAVRYCRQWQSDEVGDVIAELPGKVVDRYRADGASGDLNDYWIVAR